MAKLDNFQIARLLSGSKLFATFSPEALAGLADLAVIRSVAEKEVVFEKGKPGNEMFAILRGRMKVGAFSADGREAIFAILESGDFFGETALLDGLPRSATCTALEECEMIVIERDGFISFLEQNPSLAIQLLSILSQRLRVADEQMEEINFFPISVRLARKLLALAEEHGDKVGSKVVVAMNISQQELGSMVSATRESANKQLRQWVKEGLISLRPRMIILEDIGKLHEIGKMSSSKHAETKNG